MLILPSASDKKMAGVAVSHREVNAKSCHALQTPAFLALSLLSNDSKIPRIIRGIDSALCTAIRIRYGLEHITGLYFLLNSPLESDSCLRLWSMRVNLKDFILRKGVTSTAEQLYYITNFPDI